MKDVVIDTNIILRLFLNDVPDQTAESGRIFEKIEKGEARGIISLLVINELIWILEHFYQQKRKDYLPSILKLLGLRKIKILAVKKSFLIKVLREMMNSSLDFVDLYLAFLVEENKWKLKSFDKKLMRFCSKLSA